MAFSIGQALKAGKNFTPQGQIAGRAYSTGRKLAFGTGAVFGAIMYYFLKLGGAAAKGAIIGATVGGSAGMVAGGVIGFQIGVALAPFTFGLSIPVMTGLGVLTGGFVGGSVGAMAGGLIGLGMASGSTTAVSMGVGAGIGGTVGAVAGYFAGAAIGGALVAGCAFIIAACAALAPIVVPMSGAIGSIVGAYVGTAVGAAIGYAFGHYVVGTIGAPATGAATGATVGFAVGGPAGALVGAGIGWLAAGGWKTAWNFVKGAYNTATGGFKVVAGGPVEVAGGAPSAISGGVSAVGGAITGAASTIWGGITSAGGSIFGGLASGLNFVVGGLTSTGIPASAAMIPVVGGVGTIAVAGTIVGIATATSFFSPQQDAVIGGTGDNDAFTIEKTASPTTIPRNDSLPQDISYSIKLTAKSTLGNISISDDLQVNGKEGSFTLNTIGGKPIIENCQTPPPTELTGGQSWTCEFKITAENKDGKNFNDSVVTNKVTVTATITGQAPSTDIAAGITIIGNPPTTCSNLKLEGAWSEAEKSSISQVCMAIDKSPRFASLVAKAGTVTLTKVFVLEPGVCGIASQNNISIGCDMSNPASAKYVIIHELGHVVATYNGSVYQDFLNSGAFQSESLMPTYPFAPSVITWGVENESFAEMLADYVSSKEYSIQTVSWSNYPGGVWQNPGGSWTTFENDRPSHYNFAKEKIFGGVVY